MASQHPGLLPTLHSGRASGLPRLTTEHRSRPWQRRLRRCALAVADLHSSGPGICHEPGRAMRLRFLHRPIGPRHLCLCARFCCRCVSCVWLQHCRLPVLLQLRGADQSLRRSRVLRKRLRLPGVSYCGRRESHRQQLLLLVELLLPLPLFRLRLRHSGLLRHRVSRWLELLLLHLRAHWRLLQLRGQMHLQTLLCPLLRLLLRLLLQSHHCRWVRGPAAHLGCVPAHLLKPGRVQLLLHWWAAA